LGQLLTKEVDRVQCNQIPTHNQGDQIGRIFAYWAIVYFGAVFLKKYIRSFRAIFSTVKFMCYIILTENGLGHILGDFLANSSGHPAVTSAMKLAVV
jgi:hypothetical protein